MATFQDNIKIIQTAIYGKEMRPAISEALAQSWGIVTTMESAVEALNKRVDNLSGGGDATETIEPPILVVYGAVNIGGLASDSKLA